MLFYLKCFSRWFYLTVFKLCLTVFFATGTLLALANAYPVHHKHINNGTTYYISNSGDNNNDGTSPDAPWKTLKYILPGNTYLFKRGETFYFAINRIYNTAPRATVFDAYGKGNKPVISLYKKIHGAAWQQSAIPNIWKVDLKNKDNYTGYLNNDDTNVGFINADGDIKGAKFGDVTKLKIDWDFYSDAQYLYVYLTQNPSKAATSVQITTKVNIVNLSDDMEFYNLAFVGTGAHAIQGVNAQNDIFKNLDITDIGGSYLGKNLRYGNGIEFWQGAADCLITGCNFEKCYDVAVTMQSSVPKSNYTNVVFKNNRFKNNEQSFEFEVGDSISVFKNCKFIDNYCADAGFGWSHNVRPDKNAAVHILCYKLTKGIGGVIITNNTFINAKSGYIWFMPKPGVPVFKSFKNKISLSDAVPIKSQDKDYFIKDAAAFVAQYQLEQNSEFTVLK